MNNENNDIEEQQMIDVFREFRSMGLKAFAADVAGLAAICVLMVAGLGLTSIT